MLFRYFLGFHSSINNLPFLLLYEGSLLGNWLQTFREDVGYAFFKMSKCFFQCFPVEDITKIFIDKLGKPQPSDEGV